MTRFHWNDRSGLYTFSHDVVARLQKAGFIAYFAGGCVRDALMGTQPNDYDVATNATIHEVIELFGARQTLAIGAAFGVACVHSRVRGEKFQVEVATFRSDGTYSDGRRPDWVEFATPEADAQRRDFTINGMFFDPVADSLKDYVGGQDDIVRKTIRAIGIPDHRFQEDKLRMLRAIRFGARFGFSIDRETEQAIVRHADEIAVVSGERIAIEMDKLLAAKHADWGLNKLVELQLANRVIPHLAAAWADPVRLNRAMQLLKTLGDGGSFASRVAAILTTDIQQDPRTALQQIEHLKRSWKLSNADAERIAFSLHHVGSLLDAENLPWSTLQPLLIHEAIPDAIQLGYAICYIDRLSTGGLDRCRQALQSSRQQLNPPPLLNGQDLQAMGIPTGPLYSKLLQQVRRLQLDNQLTTKQEALDSFGRLWGKE